MKTKTIIYTRVSTGNQEASSELQKEKCLAYCNMMGYEVVEILTDSNVSGGVELFKRPEGSRIYSMIENGQADNIVTLKLDRLFRNALNGLESIKFFDLHGITFSVIDMGGSILDTKAPVGKLMMTMMLALGELEKEVTRDRVKKSLNYRKENLKVYSGSTPYGFKRSGDSLLVKESEMNVVKQMYQLKDKKSYRFIADSYDLNVSKVHRILNDEFYEKFI